MDGQTAVRRPELEHGHRYGIPVQGHHGAHVSLVRRSIVVLTFRLTSLNCVQIDHPPKRSNSSLSPGSIGFEIAFRTSPTLRSVLGSSRYGLPALWPSLAFL